MGHSMALRDPGRIVLADDPVAGAAVCGRLMGFAHSCIAHLHEGARFLGNAEPRHMDEVGETARGLPLPLSV